MAILLTSESLNSWRRFRRAAHASLLKPSADHKQDGHFKRRAASTIMSIVYDYPTILSDHDHAVERIEKFNGRLAQALTMGSYFVDIFPWMKSIPARSWIRFRSLTVNADG